MSLFFGETEITNIDNLVPQAGLDITDLWFGSTNVYTVWQTYEGTLPATINANGDNMKQYQIWGNTGGVGEPTENLCIGELARANMNSSGQIVYNSEFSMHFAQVTQGKTYSYKNSSTSVYGFFEAMPLVGSTSYDNQRIAATVTNVSFTAPITGYVAFRTSLNTQGMLTEGTTPPASFVPFGYEVDMAIGSSILQSSEIEWGGWQAAEGTIPSKIVNPARCRSKNMYSISGEKIFYDFKALNINIAFINSAGISLGGSGFKSGVGFVDVPENAVKCLFIIANTGTSTNILPAQVIAAGVWASVDATITPIYIGGDPLDKDEYVDFSKQKIYRVIDGTLTPTDPPVTLPALPTCEGTTIVDFSGSGAAPEKALLKYRKE